MTVPIAKDPDEDSIWLYLERWKDKESEERSNKSEGDENDDSSSWTTSEDKSFWLRLLLQLRCLRKCFEFLPITMAWLIGVFLPWLLLLVLSFVFGALLAFYEGPNQINENNIVMQNIFKNNETIRVITNAASFLPNVCLSIYLEGLNNTIDVASLKKRVKDELWDVNITSEETVVTRLFREVQKKGESIVSVNTTEAFNFLDTCGEAGREAVQDLFPFAAENFVNDYHMFNDLKFEWIRCTPVSQSEDYLGLDLRFFYSDDLEVEAQTELYKNAWIQDQQSLYEQYMEDLDEEANVTNFQDTKEALERSINDATGIGVCALNVAATGEFLSI